MEEQKGEITMTQPLNKNKKVFIYNYTNKLKQYNENDPKFDWDYKYTPKNMVKFTYYKKLWKYVYYGKTIEELCDRINTPILKEIELLKEKIADLEHRLIDPGYFI